MKNALLNLSTFLLVVVMFGFGCKFSTDAEPQLDSSTAESTASESKKPAIEAVSSEEIVEAFRKDKDAAKRFRGKTVTIRGNVTNINEFGGIANINLRANDVVVGLGCWLKNKTDKERVKVGDEVVVRAKIEDTDIGVVSNGEILQIN